MAKVLEISVSISPSNEYSGLISFRMDWSDLRAVQVALRGLLVPVCPGPPQAERWSSVHTTTWRGLLLEGCVCRSHFLWRLVLPGPLLCRLEAGEDARGQMCCRVLTWSLALETRQAAARTRPGLRLGRSTKWS